MIRVGMVGFGAIGSAIAGEWDRVSEHHRLAALCVRPSQVAAARAVAPDARIVTDADALLSGGDVDLYLEAAGHGAFLEIGERVLEKGHELYTLSIGALADEVFSERLAAAAARGGGRLVVPAGALAGFDGLMTLREAGLCAVRYVSTKPPRAWRGTAAEEMIDLDALTSSTVFFKGDARQAARLFPKNANLAAAVALAGLGFEATEIELVADPQAVGNLGRVEAQTASAQLSIGLQSHSFEGNPKSSAIVSASVISSLKNALAPISFR